MYTEMQQSCLLKDNWSDTITVTRYWDKTQRESFTFYLSLIKRLCKYTLSIHIKKEKRKRERNKRFFNILMSLMGFNRPHYAALSPNVFYTFTWSSVTIASFSPPSQLYSSNWKLAFMYQSKMGETDIIVSSETGSHTSNVLAALGCPLWSMFYRLWKKYQDTWPADSTD